ncbi:MAG: helix-turn-helix domain-containing protein [Pyrinomonadaceae bacterium]
MLKAVSAYSARILHELKPAAAPTTAVMDNRLQALKVLSHSILSEIEALRSEGKMNSNSKIDLAGEVQNFEADLIRCALVRTGGRQRQAARLLNVKVSTLNAKIKRFGITANGLSSLEF